MFCSIITPVYNRAWCVERALNSALKFLGNEIRGEIIVVDDGSSDSSVTVVENFFNYARSADIRCTLVRHKKNLGVCAAKNSGAMAASGEWLIFLDSDDELLPLVGRATQEALNSKAQCPLHFFSCVDEESECSVEIDRIIERNFNDYLRYGTDGEKLPIVKRSVFDRFPYDEDMLGYESLSYLRIIRNYESACLHSMSVRRYYTSNQDRLSTSPNLRRRSARLAVGHLRILDEHHKAMNSINIIRYLLKYAKSKVIFLQS